MNRKKRTILRYLLLSLFLTGCAVWKPVTQGHSNWKSRDFSAELPVGWVKSSGAEYLLVLTRDGVLLQEISLSKTGTDKELPFTKKKILPDMLLQEIADVMISEMTLSQVYMNFELLENKPVRLGGQEAFRLVYTFRNDDSLRYKCVHYGFIHQKKYYDLRYVATGQHNFPQYEKDFEHFVTSFRVRDGLAEKKG